MIKCWSRNRVVLSNIKLIIYEYSFHLQKLAMEKPCARYDELYDQELKSAEVKTEETENKVRQKFPLILHHEEDRLVVWLRCLAWVQKDPGSIPSSNP